MKDLDLPPSPPLRRGRPPSPDAQSSAQRSKAYRERLMAKGHTAVKCYLPPDAMAYLHALCDIHHVSLSEAVALAVAAALRGEPLARS